MDTPGSRQMTFGLLCLVAGALVTFAATQETGGIYVVAYGAMFAGALEFLIGLVNFIGGSQ